MHDRVVVQKSSFLLVTPVQIDEYMPLACPVCDTLMCLDDSLQWQKFKCCTRCANTWAYLLQQTWMNGWRPSEDDVRSKVATRPMMRINIGAL